MVYNINKRKPIFCELNNKTGGSTIEKTDTFYMELEQGPFEMIENGSKTIELRLYDEKRQRLSVGDLIVFTNRADSRRLTARILKLHIYDSFKELYKELPLLKCGYTQENVNSASYKDMLEYYPAEKQLAYKVAGIELEVIK